MSKLQELKKEIGFISELTYDGKFYENAKILDRLKLLGEHSTEGVIIFDTFGVLLGRAEQKWFGFLNQSKNMVYYTYVHANKCLVGFSKKPDANAVAKADEIISLERAQESVTE